LALAPQGIVTIVTIVTAGIVAAEPTGRRGRVLAAYAAKHAHPAAPGLQGAWYPQATFWVPYLAASRRARPPVIPL